MNPPADHPDLPAPKIGVLLVNLGTPNAPEPKAVKLYLKEFLSDPRVVEIPQLVWQPILRGIILNTRPKKSANAYRQVWTAEGSPLAAITARQAAALKDRFGREVIVDHAMRYGKPAIAERLDSLKTMGCDRILIAPLYPQYCAATTATANDEAFAHLRRMRWQPAIRTLPPYHDEPGYISALKSVIQLELARLDFEPEAIVASFHGMPQRTLELGDPYHCHCRKTARLVEEALDRRDLRVITTFQSRFGRAKWLEPATDVMLAQEAESGTRRLAIAAPGFSADCLETLEELAIRGREQFLAAGGEEFAALSCLNAGEPGMAMLEALVRRELAGWL